MLRISEAPHEARNGGESQLDPKAPEAVEGRQMIVKGRNHEKPLKNLLFCPIERYGCAWRLEQRHCVSALGSNINPRNTPRIPPVEIFACLGLEQNRTFFKGFSRVGPKDIIFK
jgi:hypothetical protein